MLHFHCAHLLVFIVSWDDIGGLDEQFAAWEWSVSCCIPKLWHILELPCCHLVTNDTVCCHQARLSRPIRLLHRYEEHFSQETHHLQQRDTLP